MPLATIGADSALRNRKTNPASNWPALDGLENRLWPMARPTFQPSFQIDDGARVFTMGSCFARNIESALVDCGVDVPTRRFVDDTPDIAHGFLNVYSVGSIYNEIRWALGEGKAYDFDSNLLEVAPSRYVDLHLANRAKPAPLDDVSRFRRNVLELNKSVLDCNVVILTLGLVESWWDREGEVYLNVTPPKRAFTNWPGRFELHVMDIDEIRLYLHQTFALLASIETGTPNVILTVSPVPLSQTFTGHDISVANCYSKSALRTAAQEMYAKYDFVDYFPSYESITLSEPFSAWQEDRIHVRPEIVRLNVERMLDAYLPARKAGAGDDALVKDEPGEPETGPVPRNDKARAANPDPDETPEWSAYLQALAKDHHSDAARLARSLLKAGHDDPRVRYSIARTKWKKERWEDFSRILPSPDGLPRGLYKQALIMQAECQLESGQLDAAEETIEALRGQVKKRNGSLHYLLGRLAELRRNTDLAADEYELCIRSAPSNMRFLQRYLALCNNIGNTKRAGEIEAFLKT